MCILSCITVWYRTIYSDGSFEITIDIDETYFTMDGEGTRMQQGLEGWLKANHIPFTGSDKQLTIVGIL